ncbi:MAG: serine hydrolase [Saprospiraceae bacterium]|jgi:beta-N-acetylhexosaminidase|nr:serine hydrolase [Saprospiraceae bacterium]MBV6473366.1 Beta-hexosaminidase [Saprospiraceae bacterium]
MRQGLLIWMLAGFAGVAVAQPVEARRWVDSTMSALSLREKIGQLFVIRSFARDTPEVGGLEEDLIVRYGVGGVCFFKGTTENLAARAKHYQRAARVPLLMSIDGEWGLGMRMTDIPAFPKQLCLGALSDNRPIYAMGKEIARQMRAIGLHMNFAPVADINNNPANPVINERSFGSGRKEVTAKVFAYLRGLEDGGVLACLKHFPGHGDTDVDSHADLPVLAHTRQRLDSLELYPFAALLALKPAAVMTGHLHIPELDATPQLSASLSPEIAGALLREELGFEGLIVTDALEMQGVTRNFTDDEIAIRAFEAGSDVLLLHRNVPAAIDAIEAALVSGRIGLRALEEKLRRVLFAKWRVALNAEEVAANGRSFVEDAKRKIEAINDRLYRKAMCLARDPDKNVPIRELPGQLLCLQLGTGDASPFTDRMRHYAGTAMWSVITAEQTADSLKMLVDASDVVVIHVHGLHYRAKANYGMDLEGLQRINPLLRGKRCIVVLFGCPYVARYFPAHASLVLAHEENTTSMDIAAQMLFGTDPFRGIAPVDVAPVLVQGRGVFRPSLQRMGFSIPEAQEMDRDSLQQIDQIAWSLIAAGAAPGCQIAVTRNNKIVYLKSFGHLAWDSLQAVTDQTIYDVASLTKVCCTAPVMLQLEDQGKLSFSDRYADYFPEFGAGDKHHLRFRDVFLHQGGLPAWIPFYKSTLPLPGQGDSTSSKFYDKVASREFAIPVCDSMYLRTNYLDSIFDHILLAPLVPARGYLYSDVGFYHLPRLVRSRTGVSFDRYFSREIAAPLGLQRTVFNPLAKGFSRERIAPTEEDRYWRMGQIRGYVHDMGAAMLGGIGAHAGLFSNALEVATIMQLFLNRGQWGGREILQASSVATMTRRDPERRRRALFFDMPALNDTIAPYVSPRASIRTFGHQGFTGTCAWADPDWGINYVFLSNRTYPDASVNLLHRERYRTKIQDQIYRSLMKHAQTVYQNYP